MTANNGVCTDAQYYGRLNQIIVKAFYTHLFNSYFQFQGTDK